MKSRMKMITHAAPFPIIFFDGHREVDIGNILLHPSLPFQEFKDHISQKLGIPPRHFLTYFICHNNTRSSLELHCELLIDDSFKFNALAQERDCFILAILKKFRKTRLGCRGKPSAFMATMEAKSAVPKKAIFKSFISNTLNVDLPIAVGKRHWKYMLRQSEGDQMLTEKAYTTLPEVTSMKMETHINSSKMNMKTMKYVICKNCATPEVEGRSVDFHYCMHNEEAYTKLSKMPNLPSNVNFSGPHVATSGMLASSILCKEKKNKW